MLKLLKVIPQNTFFLICLEMNFTTFVQSVHFFITSFTFRIHVVIYILIYSNIVFNLTVNLIILRVFFQKVNKGIILNIQQLRKPLRYSHK